jgi:hypothetical protein
MSGMPPTLTFAEIAHWTVDDVNAKILETLPKTWKFDLQTQPDQWRAAFINEHGQEVWAEVHFSLRLLLLSAFAWQWQRQNPARTHPAWAVREPPPLVPVAASSPHQPIPTARSLDPSFVQSVYANRHKKGSG